MQFRGYATFSKATAASLALYSRRWKEGVVSIYPLLNLAGKVWSSTALRLEYNSYYFAELAWMLCNHLLGSS